MSVFGIDYAWGRPGVKALQAAGVKFVVRYLSHDTTGKNLTAAEAGQLSAAGIWLAVIWESTSNRALAGRPAGEADATEAAKQAKSCGMPAGRPIYFAVDFDATASQQDEIHAYLDGAASVLGVGRVGLYAGYGPIKRAFDAKKITFGWQTYAWSNSKWDPRAQLQQYSNGHPVGGVDSDYDRAMTSDYGQWRVGASPTKGTDVNLSDRINLTQKDAATGKTVRLWAGAVMDSDGVSVNYALGTSAASLFYLSRTVMPQLKAQSATITELAKAVAALALNPSAIDVDALVSRIELAISQITVHLDVPSDPAP